MFIQFDLEYDCDLARVTDDIAAWSQVHNVQHRVKLVKNCLRLTFDEDKIYTWFMATWCHEQYRLNARLIMQRNL